MSVISKLDLFNSIVEDSESFALIKGKLIKFLINPESY